jgi:hypothetical protein
MEVATRPKAPEIARPPEPTFKTKPEPIPAPKSISTTESVPVPVLVPEDSEDPATWSVQRTTQNFCAEGPTVAFPNGTKRLESPQSFRTFLESNGLDGSQLLALLRSGDSRLHDFYVERNLGDLEVVMQALERLKRQHLFAVADKAAKDEGSTEEERLMARLEAQAMKLNRDLRIWMDICRHECGGNPSECHGIHGWFMRRAYKEYYTSETPGRWDAERRSYREQLASMFGEMEAGGAKMEAIHARVRDERMALFAEQASQPRQDEDEFSKRTRETTADMFEQRVPFEDIKAYLLQREEDASADLTPDTRALSERLAVARNPAEKYEAYKDFHGSVQPHDAHTVEWKDRLGSMYSERVPLSEIIKTTQKHIDDQAVRAAAQSNELQQLRDKIEENRMAWRAHKRRKAQKEEKRAAKIAEKRAVYIAMNTYPCSSIECNKRAEPFLDTEDGEDLGPPECPVCYQLWSKGHSHRYFYCSMDCLRDTWVSDAHLCPTTLLTRAD